ncbi:TerB family tellurite resistance protein [Vibrio harveyi]|uniref:TerB family tellurite resistance protein n=1 Tax=Vibrio harveyi TaxID=669 RepID=UPI0002ED60B3|nr:TerB family tellurite resistance protein [Vibrio harveyi]
MFLNALNTQEREVFLNLIINLANVDGEFSNEEQNQLSAYLTEMNLDLKEPEAYENHSSDLIASLQGSSDISKRIIFMELYALAVADGLNEEEKNLLDSIQEAFGFSDSFTSEVLDWYTKLLPMYKKGYELAGLV